MGQAKNRGSFEQRLKQAEGATTPSAKTHNRHASAEQTEVWNKLTSEEKADAAARRVERSNIRRSLIGLIGASALLGSGRAAR